MQNIIKNGFYSDYIIGGKNIDVRVTKNERGNKLVLRHFMLIDSERIKDYKDRESLPYSDGIIVHDFNMGCH